MTLEGQLLPRAQYENRCRENNFTCLLASMLPCDLMESGPSVLIEDPCSYGVSRNLRSVQDPYDFELQYLLTIKGSHSS